MTLRKKLLLPLLFLSLLLGGYLQLVWMPHSLQEAEQDHLRSVALQLDVVVEGMIPLLLADHLDMIYENLAVLIKKNPGWADVRLVHPSGRQIYPLATAGAAGPAGESLHKIEKSIDYLDTRLGTLSVVVDMALVLEKLRRQNNELALLLFAMLGLMLITIVLTLEIAVRKPLLGLAEAARNLAAEDYDAPLPEAGGGEVATLVSSFFSMRNELRQHKQELLEEHDRLLEQITERKQAEEKIRNSLERIRALREIDLAITSSLDLRTILDVLLEKTERLLPHIAATTVRLLNKETGELAPIAFHNLPEGEWKAATAQAISRNPRRLSHNDDNSPVAILNVQTEAGALAPDFLRKYGLVSGLRVPLTAKNEVLGLITFFTSEEHKFSGEEIEFLSTLAGQAAIAIHNAQLYQEATVREKNLLVAHEQLDALHTITAIASQSLDLKTVTQSVIQKITEIFAFDATRIHLYNMRRDELLLSAHFSKEPEQFSPVESFPRGQGIAGRAAENGEPLVFEDLAAEPLYESLSRSGNFEGKGHRFFAALPIKSKRLVLGTLVCIGSAPRRLSAEEVQLLTSMAGQIAVAVENASFYEEITKRADDLQKKTWELERANRAKDEFLAMISHELRTPLNVMMGYTGLLQEGMFGVLKPQQDDALKKVASQSNDLLGIITNLLRATQIGSGEIKAERARTDLGQLLDEIKNDYDLPATNGLILNWSFPSDLPIVETDSEKLKHILVNLIHNAIKFTEKGSVTITARHLPKSKRLSFTVADTGPGIAKESLPNIFDMFHQVDGSNTRAHGGLGLGLYIAKKYTELLGGKIKVKSARGRGSVFMVVLPYESSLCRESSLPTAIPESKIVEPWMTES